MDASVLAQGILAAAERQQDDREQLARLAAEKEEHKRAFYLRRGVACEAIYSCDASKAPAAAKALIELGDWLNPVGGDYLAENDLAIVVKCDTWNSRKFASLILKVALFDGDELQTRSLIETAISKPPTMLGDVALYLGELLECWWERSRFEPTLPTGQPNLGASPFTTPFESVIEFAAALKGLPGYSREQIDRKRSADQLITDPPWTRNAVGPRRYKFCNVQEQRKVLEWLRAHRTPVTTLQPDSGTSTLPAPHTGDETHNTP